MCSNESRTRESVRSIIGVGPYPPGSQQRAVSMVRTMVHRSITRTRRVKVHRRVRRYWYYERDQGSPFLGYVVIGNRD